MDQTQVESVEKRLAKDRGIYYRGTARVRFDHLCFENAFPRDRYTPDRTIVEILQQRFETEGCLRLEPANHIPAVIDQSTLDSLTQQSPNVLLTPLIDFADRIPPEIECPNGISIKCLQGRHRIEAGRKFLPPRDWWWTIDLYLSDGSRDLQKALSEEYTSSVNFSDGEIYLQLRQYNDMTDKSESAMYAEQRMLARLSADKRKDLRQMLKNEALTVAFDALRIIPAIWGGFRIEHKFLSMKCHEELLNYLRHILQVWTEIFEGSSDLMRKLDRSTVREVELRAPGYSREDCAYLKGLFVKGELFSRINDQDDRSRIWNNLQKIKTLVPSLFSFFEDIKYLKVSAKAMRQLFPASKLTTRKAMYRIFTSGNQTEGEYLVQESEKSFRRAKGRSEDQFEFCYQQMWLALWRLCFDLVPECPRKEDGEKTPKPQGPSPAKWYQVAELAERLGYESSQITNFLRLDPDRETARKTLEQARDPNKYEFDAAEYEDHICRMSAMFKTASYKKAKAAKPALLVDGVGERLERRCGRVFARAHEHDKNHLFLSNLYDPRVGEGASVSSFLVRRSVYFAFFGKHPFSCSEKNPPSGTSNPPQESRLDGTADSTSRPMTLQAVLQSVRRSADQEPRAEQGRQLKEYRYHATQKNADFRQERERSGSVLDEQHHRLEQQQRELLETSQALEVYSARLAEQERTLEERVKRQACVERKSHRVQKQHVQGDRQHRQLQKQGRSQDRRKAVLYESSRQGEPLEKPGTAAERSRSNSTSIGHNNTVGDVETLLAMDVQRPTALLVPPNGRDPKQDDSTERPYDVDKSFTEAAPDAIVIAEDQPARYTRFEFSDSPLQQEKGKEATPRTGASTGSRLDTRGREVAITNQSTNSNNADTASSPLEIHFEICQEDGSYRLSQVMHVDVLDVQPARSMVIKHLRKGTPMILQNKHGQVVNANNFHVGMSTAEVNVVRFVPYRLLGYDSRAAPMEDSDSTDQLIRRKLKGI